MRESLAGGNGAFMRRKTGMPCGIIQSYEKDSEIAEMGKDGFIWAVRLSPRSVVE